MKQRITPDKREVSFNELWWYVLSKWRVFTIGFIIGTIVMAVIASMVNIYSGSSVVFMSEDELEASLTQSQLDEVDRTVVMNKEYQEAVAVNKDSYIMKLNASMSYRYNCQFYVTADTIEETENIMELLRGRVKGTQVVDAINALNIFGMDESDMDGIIVATYVGGVLDVTVYGKETDVKAIGAVISNELKVYSQELKDLVGKFQMATLNENVSKASSLQIRELQEYRNEDMKFMQTVLNERVSSLSANQKSLYDIKIGANPANSNAAIINTVKRMNGVHVILGSIMAVMIMVFVAIIRFLAGPKLRSVNEIDQVYNVEILGKIISEKNSSGLDRAVAVKRHHYNGLNDTEEQIEYLANSIINKCNINGLTNVTLCNVDNNEIEIKEKIKTSLEKNGIACDFVKDIVRNSDALNKIINTKNTIIIGQTDVSLKKNLTDEVVICDKFGINVIGMIVLI